MFSFVLDAKTRRDQKQLGCYGVRSGLAARPAQKSARPNKAEVIFPGQKYPVSA
jgi:hypothetical protein